MIRNVSYILEQQELKTRAMYDRMLGNTLSHELLTPLNCIINMSNCLEDELEDFIREKKASEHADTVKLLGSTKDNAKLVWCSGKILEFTIRSMINRQRFMNENNVII